MDAILANQVRREQAQRDLAFLKSSISTWLEYRRMQDRDEQGMYVGRHETQLAALKSVLLDAIQVVERGLIALPLNQPRGDFYEDCRDYDQVVIWLRRIWEYFKEKFDQRDDARMGPLLKAADEIIWSCYRQVFILASTRDRSLKQGPTPLPFIEPAYSPAAWQSDKPLPATLRLNPAIDLDEQIADAEKDLKGLPIPVLQLPPWCLEAPWWLIYIGHEVGHHVQHDLRLVDHFMTGLRQVASAHLSRPDADRWGKWGEEIFADIFSVLVMGQCAVWALTEVLWSPPAIMLKAGGDVYPPPAVRLALVARTADTLGMEGTAALHGLSFTEFATDKTITNHMNVVTDAVKFALGPLRDNLGTLQNLCQLDPMAFRRDTGKVAMLARILRMSTALPVERQLETARLLVSGSLQSWSTLVMEPEATTRENERINLASRTIAALRNNAPPGTRAGLAPGGQVPGKGEDLAHTLLQASRKRRT